ncbi:hypothetical protein GCM10009665_72420 [Kitasatospora nipponensis]|uniref:Transcriptional regulator n=1 Tax=Kitasatospora nipponensis TaxID=258049 RepID=A0ABN1X2L2_9ACTN
MASAVGLPEERELAARERVEELREVADRVLAEPAGPMAARWGSIVPVWRPALAMAALAAHDQRILTTLTEEASGGKSVMPCQEITAVLGRETVPASVKGVRSKMKRLTDRGWADEPTSGRFTLAAGPAGGP